MGNKHIGYRHARANRRPTKRYDKNGLLERGTNAALWDKIMDRDNRRCGYCGKTAQQVDHILPIWHGGQTVPTNLTAACRTCNLSKMASLNLAWMTRLHKNGTEAPRRKARIFLARGHMFPTKQVTRHT